MYRERQCWLCGRNGAGDPLDKHHIFGGARRSKSEKLGLYVYLCHHDCHLYGPMAAHQNRETMERLHKFGQLKAMEEQGFTVEEFIMEFGKNYLEPEEMEFMALEPASVGSFCTEEGELPW